MSDSSVGASSVTEAVEEPRVGVFRALRHRNYKLFFAGQIVSLVGSWLTLTATSWLVWRLTHSATMLGVVAFSGQIMMFALPPIAGVWVDRLNRQKLLVITQTLAMLESFALAYLALKHIITVPEIIGLNLFQGTINAFDMPGRQAFLVEMVTDRADLANAIALNSIMVHFARLLGPAIAGFLIWWVGEGLCFTIDGISYIGVIAALLAMRIAPRPRRPTRSMTTEMKEGFHYVWHFLPIRVLLLTMAAISLTGMPALSVLMPIYAAHFVGGAMSGAGVELAVNSGAGAQIFGVLGAASGLGALTAAYFLARRKTVVGLGRLIAIAAYVFSAALIAFSQSRALWLSLLLVPVAGWGAISLFASCNTLLQTLADEDKRGRVMAFFGMAFVGMTPFGSLIAGELASRLTPHGAEPIVGASRTLLLEAGICILTATAYLKMLPVIRRVIRPIYIKKGILPAIADGLAASAQVAREE
ncbi:MAG TPA: MFS transporter [Tepidisphaeraceae bacterium]|nr:MFS transporter [Tepidisphaeraceae bacterium]